MWYGRRPAGRERGRERVREQAQAPLGGFRHVVGAGVSIALAPALDLALHITFGLAKVRETGGFQIERMDIGLQID